MSKISPRTVAVVTGTRAEYGLLFWLLKEIASDPALKLRLLVTGSHLSCDFGQTGEEIEKDGLRIDEKIEILTEDDSAVGISKSMARALTGFAESFQKDRPDLVVILGDRYEIFGAAQAAMLARIPIAHIHGGELTEGAMDDSIRHSLTKMAQLHFVTAEPYRKRVIQLGEQPDRVFSFGAPTSENLKRLEFLSKVDLEKRLKFSLDRPYLLLTYHPVTLEAGGPLKALNELLAALNEFPNYKIVLTKSNADEGGRAINVRLDEFAAAHSDRVMCSYSLGHQVYLSAMKHCAAVVGNSSSGLIEAPFFKVPTVNIGDRQKGRLQAESVIDSEEKHDSIVSALRKALSPEFQSVLRDVQSPYGSGNVSVRIKEELKKADLSDILKKKFYDL